jgi:RND superfamily putative drug exporter
VLDRIANLTWRHPKLVLSGVGAFVLVALAFGTRVEDHLKAAGFTDPASESEKATELLRAELGYDATPGIVLLVRPKGGGALDTADPAVQAEVARLAKRMNKARFIGKVNNPLAPLARAPTVIPPGVPAPDPAAELRERSPLIADDGRSLVVTGHLTSQDIEEDGGTAAEDAERLLHSDKLRLGLTGFAPGFNEVNDQTREDLNRAELIAFPILAILLLFFFRGVVAALIPLMVGGISILGTFLMLRVLAEFVDTSVFALNIATGLSLGLAVDYALLMVSRYREELDRDGATHEAHERTLRTAGKTIIFSGFTVAIALAGLIVFPQRFLYSLGATGFMVGVLASTVALLTVGSLLALLGERVNALAVRRGPAISDTSGGWYRLASGVMRRPVAVALASSVAMLAAAYPLLSSTLTGPSAEAVPPTQPSYPVAEYMERTYPTDVREPIIATARGRASNAQLGAFNRRIARIDGIRTARPFVRASRRVSYATFGPDGKALHGNVQDGVREIRSLDAPGGSELLVSGNTARFIDQKQSIVDHLPLVIAIVAVTTIFLLFMLTGSVILPLKTLVMNGLTLSATLGLLVLAFQEGALAGPLDYTGPSAIEVTTLVFLFAISFGLATDYAVLVMARIKEHHDRGMPNEEAVATGIARTGRVITAAAVMLAVVFLAFATSKVFFMKQAGVGQAAAVLIDATIVRALLVPSLMRLFGDWNWWAPAPLRRFQEHYGFREEFEEEETMRARELVRSLMPSDWRPWKWRPWNWRP